MGEGGELNWKRAGDGVVHGMHVVVLEIIFGGDVNSLTNLVSLFSLPSFHVIAESISR